MVISRAMLKATASVYIVYKEFQINEAESIKTSPNLLNAAFGVMFLLRSTRISQRSKLHVAGG